jgi:type II secretory pathway component GspD/PulD (secretin)
MKKSLCLVVTALAFVSCRHLGRSPEAAATATDPDVQAVPTPRTIAEKLAEHKGVLEDKVVVFTDEQRESHRRALDEVEERMMFPGSYGKTVVISRESEPFALPPGPMEELVQRKVSMRLREAGVRDVVMALSEIDGMNIIADEALTSAQKLTISVTDVPLHELLSYIARNMGVAFHIGANTVWVTTSDTPAGGPRLETRIFRLKRGFIPTLSGSSSGGSGIGSSFGAGTGGRSTVSGSSQSDDTDLEDALEQFLEDSPPSASFRIFRDRNVLIVRNSRERLRLVEELLATFDRPPPQVLIEARFVNLSQEDFFELGADIEKLTIDAGDRLQVEGSSVFPDALVGDALGGKLSLSGVIGNKTYDIVLRALAQQDAVHTLSAPRVTVMNNRQASIHDGRREFFYEEYDLSNIDEGDSGTQTRLVPAGRPTELEYGIALDVSVNVGNDGKTVTLSLHPKITIPDGEGFEEFPVGETGSVRLPRYFESSVQTTVAVNSGDTVVLGGTMSNSKSQTRKKIPVLGNLPLIGFLFRHVIDENKPKHLLIFVTATVVGSTGEFIEVQEIN